MSSWMNVKVLQCVYYETVFHGTWSLFCTFTLMTFHDAGDVRTLVVSLNTEHATAADFLFSPRLLTRTKVERTKSPKRIFFANTSTANQARLTLRGKTINLTFFLMETGNFESSCGQRAASRWSRSSRSELYTRRNPHAGSLGLCLLFTPSTLCVSVHSPFWPGPQARLLFSCRGYWWNFYRHGAGTEPLLFTLPTPLDIPREGLSGVGVSPEPRSGLHRLSLH